MKDLLTNVDSSTVLWGQTILYTVYCLLILSLMAWLATRLTKEPKKGGVSSKLFYGWVIFLVCVGVSLHLVTYNTIPWVQDDLANRQDVAATYDISIGWDATGDPPSGKWNIPGGQLQIPCGELVAFQVKSDDLTYGFGIFRSDHSLVAQMQVVPGHTNRLVWTFTENATYYIQSTEYSGPTGSKIIAKDAIVVAGCK